MKEHATLLEKMKDALGDPGSPSFKGLEDKILTGLGAGMMLKGALPGVGSIDEKGGPLVPSGKGIKKFVNKPDVELPVGLRDKISGNLEREALDAKFKVKTKDVGEAKDTASSSSRSFKDLSKKISISLKGKIPKIIKSSNGKSKLLIIAASVVGVASIIKNAIDMFSSDDQAPMQPSEKVELKRFEDDLNDIEQDHEDEGSIFDENIENLRKIQKRLEASLKDV